MRVLLTGGNGYVGRVLTRLLFQEHEVAVLDNLRIGRLRLSEADLERIRFYETDVRDAGATARVVADFRPDAIVHLAAIHFIPECESNPADAMVTNVVGTVNLLSACAPRTRFIFASTAAVYAPGDAPHNEDESAIGPVDVYGLSKLHAEECIRYWSKLKQLDAVIVRLFNVIGPGETNPHVMPAIMAQAVQGRTTLALGNCYPRRDYIDVQDAAAGFATILGRLSGEPKLDVVNLGTGNAYSVHDVVAELSRVSGRAFVVETDPARVRASERPFLSADTTKMREQYGWTPRMNLQSSLEALWREPDLAGELVPAC